MKKLTDEIIKKEYIKKLQNSRFNRYFIYEKDSPITYFLDGTAEYSWVTFRKDGVDLCHEPLETIMILFKEAVENRYPDEMWKRMTYYEEIDSMSESFFWNILYEFSIIAAGVTDAYEVAVYPYKRYKHFEVDGYDIYIYNYYSKSYSKKFANLTFHINAEDKYRKDEKVHRWFAPDLKTRGWNEKELKDVIKEFIGWESMPRETKYYFNRYLKKLKCDNSKYSDRYNDINGDFYLCCTEEMILLHCRKLSLQFNHRVDDEQQKRKLDNCIIYNEIVNRELAIDVYRLIGEIRLLLTGAGDISHEEVTNPDGSKSYNIFVEKEYETSYTKQFGNMTFYVNNGYKHKTEQERLEDFFASTEEKLENMSDIVRNILHPLQTTKASRFLCYKLIEDETTTLYFNGKDGDFYLKAKGEELMFHCRDMAICFTDNAKDMAEEDDDIWQYKDMSGDESLKSLFTAAYEMIFILAGAGEVTHEAVDGGTRYRISLEREYVDDYTKTIGNVVFDVRREVYEKDRV